MDARGATALPGPARASLPARPDSCSRAPPMPVAPATGWWSPLVAPAESPPPGLTSPPGWPPPVGASRPDRGPRPARSATPESSPALGWVTLKRLLPCLLQSEADRGELGRRAVVLPERWALEFEMSLWTVLGEERRFLGLLELTDADDTLARFSTTELRILGYRLWRLAPLPVASYTRYHCFAMCVAGELERRGVAVD